MSGTLACPRSGIDGLREARPPVKKITPVKQSFHFTEETFDPVIYILYAPPKQENIKLCNHTTGTP
jgi:hypothetical protein